MFYGFPSVFQFFWSCVLYEQTNMPSPVDITLIFSNFCDRKIKILCLGILTTCFIGIKSDYIDNWTELVS